MDRRLGRDASEDGARESSRGAVLGFAAYLIWGTMPLYFRLLDPAGAWEILAHRIVWSLALCLALLALLRRPSPTWRRPASQNAGLALAGLLIAVNWVTYLVAVTSGRVTEAALGYFLNPVVSVALGLVLLGERLRALQSVAVAVGASGGVFLALTSPSVPWAAFLLAFSFGFYGLVKKRLLGGLGAIEGMTYETAVLAPAAVGVIVWLTATGRGTAFTHGPAHTALLVSTGVATAVPLILFAMAASRVRLVTLGMLQFIAPVLQFVTGLFLGEPMGVERWIGFGIVWVAVLLLMTDSVLERRAATRPRGA